MESLNKHKSPQTGIDEDGWTDLGPPLSEQARVPWARGVFVVLVLVGGAALILGLIFGGDNPGGTKSSTSSAPVESAFSDKEKKASNYCERAMISELMLRRGMDQATVQSFERIESTDTAYGPAVLVTAKVKAVKDYFPTMYKIVCAYTDVDGTPKTEIGQVEPIAE